MACSDETIRTSGEANARQGAAACAGAWASRAVRLALGVVLCGAAFGKVADADGFSRILAAGLSVPGEAARGVAARVVVVEAGVGALLLFPIRSRWPLVAVIVLLSIFTVWLFAREFDAPGGPCGCRPWPFGGDGLSARGAIVRNIGLIASAVAAIALARPAFPAHEERLS